MRKWPTCTKFTVLLMKMQSKQGVCISKSTLNAEYLVQKLSQIGIHRRLRDIGTFARATDIIGRPVTVRTPEPKETVLHEIDGHPERSTRKIASTFDVSHKTVLRILKENLLYPYHIQSVRVLLLRDFPPGEHFCQWVLQRAAENPQFLSQVLWTDEANCSRNAIQNFHNNHVWAEANPHAITEDHYQHQFSLNVWVGIIGDFLIGPFFLPPRVNETHTVILGKMNYLCLKMCQL